MLKTEQEEKFPFPATVGIIAFTGIIYIISFLCELNQIDLTELVHQFSNHRYYTLDWQWWRLLTNIFIHQDHISIIINFHVLMFMGLYLESLIGGWKVLLVYILSGIVSSGFALIVIENNYIYGPYGAICGLAGVYIALMISKTVPTRQWFAVVWVTLVYSIIVLLVLNGNWITIMTGLITGFVLGLAYFPVHEMGPENKGHARVVVMMVLFIVLPVISLLLLLPNKVMIYEERMAVFYQTEGTADQTFRNVLRLGKKEWIHAVKVDCIDGWKNNHALATELSGMGLPYPYRYRNKKAIQYSYVQLQKSRLLLRSLQDDKYHYKQAMDNCDVELNYLKIAMTQ